MPRAELIVPAGHGRAVRLVPGEVLEVVNLHGTQVVDSWAFGTEDPTEVMSMAQSRSVNSRLWPLAGQALVSSRRRPMLRLLSDTSPGVHDTLLCACNGTIYAELGCAPGHRSCEGNLFEVLAAEGVMVGHCPAPLNLFMNVTVGPDGAVLRGPPVSRPGDAVTFRAEMSLLVVLSACPQDVTPINGAGLLPRDVLVRWG